MWIATIFDFSNIWRFFISVFIKLNEETLINVLTNVRRWGHLNASNIPISLSSHCTSTKMSQISSCTISPLLPWPRFKRHMQISHFFRKILHVCVIGLLRILSKVFSQNVCCFHPVVVRGWMRCKIMQFVSCLKYTSKYYWVNFITIGPDYK